MFNHIPTWILESTNGYPWSSPAKLVRSIRKKWNLRRKHRINVSVFVFILRVSLIGYGAVRTHVERCFRINRNTCFQHFFQSWFFNAPPNIGYGLTLVGFICFDKPRLLIKTSKLVIPYFGSSRDPSFANMNCLPFKNPSSAHLWLKCLAPCVLSSLDPVTSSAEP